MKTEEEIQKYIDNRLNVMENIIDNLNCHINELAGVVETIHFLSWLKEKKSKNVFKTKQKKEPNGSNV